MNKQLEDEIIEYAKILFESHWVKMLSLYESSEIIKPY